MRGPAAERRLGVRRLSRDADGVGSEGGGRCRLETRPSGMWEVRVVMAYLGPQKRPGRPAVSVVVPFLGDERDAATLLGSLRRLRVEPTDELVVADNTPDGVMIATVGADRPALVAPVHGRGLRARAGPSRCVLRRPDPRGLRRAGGSGLGRSGSALAGRALRTVAPDLRSRAGPDQSAGRGGDHGKPAGAAGRLRAGGGLHRGHSLWR